MSPLETAVRIMVSLLVRGEYETMVKVATASRLGPDDLRGAVERYGRTLVEPGADWWRSVDIVPITGAASKVHVAASLWTKEEGLSDLTLELWSEEYAPGLVRSEILDLHVV